jgi:hypothetical protein
LTLLIPFTLAVLIGVGFRASRTWEAADIIARVAGMIVKARANGVTHTEDIVKQIVSDRDTTALDRDTLDYLPALIRTLADEEELNAGVAFGLREITPQLM